MEHHLQESQNGVSRKEKQQALGNEEKNHSIDEASKGNVTLEDNTEGDQYSEQVSSNFEGDANAAVLNMAFEKLIEVFVCFDMHLFL